MVGVSKRLNASGADAGSRHAEVCALCYADNRDRYSFAMSHEDASNEGGEDNRCGGVTQNSNTTSHASPWALIYAAPSYDAPHYRRHLSKFPAPTKWLFSEWVLLLLLIY